MKFSNRYIKFKIMKVRIVVVFREGILLGKDIREFFEVKKRNIIFSWLLWLYIIVKICFRDYLKLCVCYFIYIIL